MKEPIVKVFVKETNKDLSNLVETIRYEDSMEKDNLLILNLKSDTKYSLIDSEELKTGTILSVQWGYAGLSFIKVQQVRITDIEIEYSSRVRITLTALDIGNVLKKATSQKIWKNKLGSEVITEIATEYNMEVFFDDIVVQERENRKDYPQANKSDFDFLKQIVRTHYGGQCVMYIRNNILFVVKRAIEKKPILSLKYGDGKIISFTPSLKESSSESAGTNTTATSVNPLDKKSVEDTHTKQGVNTGKAQVFFSIDGEEKNTKIENKILSTFDAGSGKGKGKGNLEGKNTATSIQREENYNMLEATLETEGNPYITPNELVTISNVAKRHTGNWLITEVEHSITQKGYYTTCVLKKEATLKPTGKGSSNNENVNNEIGNNNIKAKKTIKIFYNIDGTEIKK